MVQRRQHARFTLEPRDALAVVAERFREELDGDGAPQLRVGGLIDLAHAAGTEMAGDLVVREA